MKFILSLTIISLCFTACNSGKSKTSGTVGKTALLDTNPAECPFLTTDAKGNAVISWIREINDSTTAFCYARSYNGQTFSSPVVIPNSNNIQLHGENLPKIVFKPSGEIIALWGAANPNPKNKYSGQVFYTQSFDEGRTWTKARPLVSDTAGYDQRYYDIALLSNGEAGIIWLDNRKTTSKEGSALYFASTSGKNGFEVGKLISQPCCQCCRTDLYVDKKGGIHALFRGIVQDSIRDMIHIVSTDGGNSFSEPKRISEDNWVINGCPHTGPAMTENSKGLHFAWFTGGKKKGCYYTQSKDNGKSFVMHDSISSRGSHPQLASLSNGEILIAWDETMARDNKIVKQVCIQRRNAEGKASDKEFISENEYEASFPVVAPLNDKAFIVAYTIKKDQKNYVAYRAITVRLR